jgi:hypothetical protein
MTRPELDAVRGVLTAHGWTRWTEVPGPEDTRDEEGNVIEQAEQGYGESAPALIGQTDDRETWAVRDPDGDIWLAPRAAPEVADAKDRAVEALAEAVGMAIPDNYTQGIAFRL